MHVTSRKQRRGLTLMELLVVLSILAITTTVAVQLTDGVIAQGRFDATRRILGDVRNAIAGIPAATASEASLGGYVADMGGYPLSLGDLVSAPRTYASYSIDTEGDGAVDGTLPGGWRGPYLRVGGDLLVRDAWGNPLAYAIAGDGTLTVHSSGGPGFTDVTALAQLRIDIPAGDYTSSARFHVREMRKEMDEEQAQERDPKLDPGDVLELRVYRPFGGTVALYRFACTTDWPNPPPAPPSQSTPTTIGVFNGVFSHQLTSTAVGPVAARAVIRNNTWPFTFKKKSDPVYLTLTPRADVIKKLYLR